MPLSESIDTILKIKVVDEGMHSFSDIGAGFGVITAAATGVAAGLGASVDAAAKWQKQMEVIQGNTDSTSAQMKYMDDQIQKMGRTSPASLNDIATGFERVTTFGFKGADAVKVVHAAMEAAVITGGKVADMGSTLASSMSNFNIKAKDASKTMDELLVISAQGNLHLADFAQNFANVGASAKTTGVSIRDAAAALVTMTLTGESSHRAAMQVNAAINALGHTTPKAWAAMTEAGHKANVNLTGDITALINHHGSFLKVIQDVQKAGHGNVQMLHEMFPNIAAFAAVSSLAGAHYKQFTDIIKAGANATGETNKIYLEHAHSISAVTDELKNMGQEALIAIGDKLTPVLAQMGIKLLDLGSWLSDHGKDFSTFFTEVGKSFSPLLGSLEQLGKAILKPFGLFQSEPEKAKKPINELKVVLDDVAGAAKKVATGIDDTVKFLTKIAPIIGPVAIGCIAAGTGMEAWAGATSAYNAVAGLFFTETAAAAVSTDALAVAAGAAATETEALDVAMSLNPIGLVVVSVAALVAGFILAYQHSSMFRDIINNLWNELRTLWGDLESAVVRFKDFIGQVVAAVERSKDFQNNLKAISGAFNELKSAGQSVIDGIKNLVGSFDGAGASSAKAKASTIDWANILTNVLLAAFTAVTIAIKLVADGISSAVTVIGDEFTLAETFVKDLATVFHDAATLIYDLFHGNWSKLGADAAAFGHDLLKLFGDLWTNALKLLSDFATGYLKQFDDLTGGSASKLVKWAGDTLGAIKTWIGDCLSALGTWSSSALATVSGWVTSTVTFFKDLPGKIVAALGDMFGVIGTSFANLNTSLNDWMAAQLADFAAWATDVPHEISTAITQGIPHVMGALGNMYDQFGQWERDRLADFLAWATSIPPTIATAVTQGIPHIMGVFGNIKDQLVQWQLDRVADFLAWATSIPPTIATAVTQGIPHVMGAFGAMKDQFVQWQTDRVADFLAWAGNVITAVWNGITQGIPKAMSALGALRDQFVQWQTDRLADFLKWATSVPGKIAEGITQEAPKIIAALVKAVTDAMGAAKDAIGNLAGGLFGAVGNVLHSVFATSGSSGGTNPSGGGYSGNPADLGAATGFQSSGPFHDSGVESGNQQMYASMGIGYTGSLLDWDYPGASQQVYLPGTSKDKYTYLNSLHIDDSRGHMGTADFFHTPGGGDFQTNHMQGAPGFTPGQTVTGGTDIGTSGYSTGEFGSGYHLCIVTDAAGRQFLSSLTDSQMTNARANGAKVAGGGGGFTDNGNAPRPGHSESDRFMPSGGSHHGFMGDGASVPTVNLSGTSVNALAAASIKQSSMSFGSATAAFANDKSSIPALLDGLNKLPPAMADKFKQQVAGLAEQWKTDGTQFNTKMAGELHRHETALGSIHDKFIAARSKADETYQAKIKSINDAHATQLKAIADGAATARARADSAQNTARGTADTNYHRAVATENTNYHNKVRDANDSFATMLAHHRGSTTALLAAHSNHMNTMRLDHEDKLRGIYTTHENKLTDITGKHVAGLSGIATKHVIDVAAQDKIALEARAHAINTAKENRDAAINKENQQFTGHVDGMKAAFGAHVAALTASYAGLKASIQAALDPGALFKSLQSAAQGLFTSAMDSFAAMILSGQAKKAVPLTAIQQKRNDQATADGQSDPYTQTYGQQALQGLVALDKEQQKYADAVAKASLEFAQASGDWTTVLSDLQKKITDKITNATDGITVALVTGKGNISDFTAQIVAGTAKLLEWTAAAAETAVITAQATGSLTGLMAGFSSMSTIITDQVNKGLLAGQPIQQSYIDGLVKIADAQEIATEVTTGLNLIVAAARDDLAGMSSAVATLTTQTEGDWTRAVADGGGEVNQYTAKLVQLSQETEKLAHAQADQDIVVGEITGNAAKLTSGLSALFTATTSGMAYFTAMTGRVNEGGQKLTDSFGTLVDKSITAASNLGSLSDIVSALGTVITGITNQAGTEYARTGSVSGDTAASYTKATAEQTKAAWDTVGSQLSLAHQTNNLTDYYAALGKEIPLEQEKLVNLGVQFGTSSAQYQAQVVIMQGMNREYTGLGDEIKSLGSGVALTGDAATTASWAMGVFASGIDPATVALTGAAGAFTTSVTDTGTALTTASTGATDLGTQATAAATQLGALATAVTTLITQIANLATPGAVSVSGSPVNVNGSVSGSSSSTSSSSTASSSQTPGAGGHFAFDGSGPTPAAAWSNANAPMAPQSSYANVAPLQPGQSTIGINNANAPMAPQSSYMNIAPLQPGQSTIGGGGGGGGGSGSTFGGPTTFTPPPPLTTTTTTTTTTTSTGAGSQPIVAGAGLGAPAAGVGIQYPVGSTNPTGVVTGVGNLAYTESGATPPGGGAPGGGISPGTPTSGPPVGFVPPNIISSGPTATVQGPGNQFLITPGGINPVTGTAAAYGRPAGSGFGGPTNTNTMTPYFFGAGYVPTNSPQYTSMVDSQQGHYQQGAITPDMTQAQIAALNTQQGAHPYNPYYDSSDAKQRQAMMVGMVRPFNPLTDAFGEGIPNPAGHKSYQQIEMAGYNAVHPIQVAQQEQWNAAIHGARWNGSSFGADPGGAGGSGGSSVTAPGGAALATASGQQTQTQLLQQANATLQAAVTALQLIANINIEGLNRIDVSSDHGLVSSLRPIAVHTLSNP